MPCSQRATYFEPSTTAQRGFILFDTNQRIGPEDLTGHRKNTPLRFSLNNQGDDKGWTIKQNSAASF
tara:strand:+ start:66707 stop:66907 length:201 start_codon:yes stop_codon:yes gene_type:complete